MQIDKLTDTHTYNKIHNFIPGGNAILYDPKNKIFLVKYWALVLSNPLLFPLESRKKSANPF